MAVRKGGPSFFLTTHPPPLSLSLSRCSVGVCIQMGRNNKQLRQCRALKQLAKLEAVVVSARKRYKLEK